VLEYLFAYSSRLVNILCLELLELNWRLISLLAGWFFAQFYGGCSKAYVSDKCGWGIGPFIELSEITVLMFLPSL